MNMLLVRFRFCITFVFNGIYALENGLARTPPMGWSSRLRFGCQFDDQFDVHPFDSLSETFIERIANIMWKEGYGKVGYRYIIIDECWMAEERDEFGKLQSDPSRFPSGMKYLSDYIHKKGLRFGLSHSYKDENCGNEALGMNDLLQLDANTFAEWGVDYVKLTACGADPKDIQESYISFGNYLKKTERPIVYACTWPLHLQFLLLDVPINYTLITEVCNTWRTAGDIHDSWASVLDTVVYNSQNQETFQPLAGPGHWNDLDTLILGNYGLSLEQSKAQIALWAIFSSPLIMSVDLKNIRQEFKEILLNQEIIAINQDPLGIAGFRKLTNDTPFNLDLFLKPIVPKIDGYNSFAVAVLSRRTEPQPIMPMMNFHYIGLQNPSGYMIQNVFKPTMSLTCMPDDTVYLKINPTGIILFTAKVRSFEENMENINDVIKNSTCDGTIIS